MAKGIRGLEVVMPQTEIPEWFDWVDNINGGNPRFWARGKFPIIALALAFEDVSERARQSRRQLVELHLLINGRCVPRKGYYNFKIAADHVLICDLRLLFSDKEWLGLDAFLEHEWNLVRVSYEAPSTLTLSGWGVFVYEEGANMEDVQFMCPDPKYSDMSPTKLVPTTKDPRQERKKMIDNLCLDEMFDGMLMETMDYEERDDFADKDFAIEQMHILMGGLKDLSTQAKDELESNGSALQDNNKNSTLTWLLDTIKKIDNGEAEPQSFYHKDLALIELKDKVKPPMDAAEEASTSGHQLQEMMREIFYDGITDGLLEAQNIFPSLDIVKIRSAAMNKGNRVAWSAEGNVILPTVEMRTYTSGVLGGLVEAKEVCFPDLDIWATLNTVVSRRGIQASLAAPPTVPQLDWTTIVPPSSRSQDPLLEAFLMMKPESSESEAKSKLFWKFNEEHQALRNKYVQLENENAAPDKDISDTASSPWKNQYEELIQKFNTQSDDEFIAKKHDIIACKCDTEYEKVCAVLKGRAEELGKLYNAGIEGFQNSQEFQDLISAIYLSGLRDGLLEAQAVLLALNMDRKTPVFKEKEEEHVIDHDVAVNESPIVADIPIPIGPDVDNPIRDTDNPSSSKDFFNWQEFI